MIIADYVRLFRPPAYLYQYMYMHVYVCMSTHTYIWIICCIYVCILYAKEMFTVLAEQEEQLALQPMHVCRSQFPMDEIQLTALGAGAMRTSARADRNHFAR